MSVTALGITRAPLSDGDAARVAAQLAHRQETEPVPPAVELEEDGLEAVLDVRRRNAEAAEAAPDRAADRVGPLAKRGQRAERANSRAGRAGRVSSGLAHGERYRCHSEE